MIKIGICDDEKMCREKLRMVVEEYFQNKEVEYQIKEYESGKEFIEQSEQVDVLLLDIAMEEVDGIQVKNWLQQNANIYILFVTSYIEGMPEAFGKNVYGFLEKPVQEEKFSKYMNAMVEDMLDKEKILLECVNKEVAVNIQDILCFQAEKKYSYVKMIESELFCDSGLKVLEEKLVSKLFFRCHKSYLVNLRNIMKIEEDVCMINGEKIPVARSKKQELKEAFRNYVIRKAR